MCSRARLRSVWMSVMKADSFAIVFSWRSSVMGGAAAPEAAAHAVQHPAERPPLGGEAGPAQREEQLPEDPAARDEQQRARDREQRRRLAAQPLARVARDLERVHGTAPGRELALELQALRRDP